MQIKDKHPLLNLLASGRVFVTVIALAPVIVSLTNYSEYEDSRLEYAHNVIVNV